ncbi:MAG: nitroreductase family protein, partial [Candidatus Omnitrophica bacterium]|nr:nitroreductase family protein [Candidatus Omnitrophota bacterium]
LRWAAYIHPEGIPPSDKRPSNYIVVLVNMHRAKKEFFAYDVGASVENILLVSWSYGIGGCWIESIDRKSLKEILKVPSHIRIDSVIALGYRDETPKIERFKNSVRYWKDKKGVLHVPKRELKDILHFDYYKG